MDDLSIWSASGGLLIGFLFGLVMQRSRFCMVAAVSNILLIRDYRYVQAFLAAWAVAIAGAAVLESTQLVAISDSAYRGARLDWFGAVAGGLLFGVGAALAGGCSARTLINTAEGHMGGLLVLLVMAVFCGITQFGPLEPVRISLMERTAIQLQSGDNGLAALLNVAPWIIGLVTVLGCLLFIRLFGNVKENRALILAGGSIGLLIVAAWSFTGWLASDPFASTVASAAAITGPLARYSYYLATGTGLTLSFAIAFVPGILVGAASSAVATKTFHLVRPDPSRIPHYIIGGIFMGVGAITAGGCNIGQGLSGVSTLSVTSLLATVGIFTGAVFGVKWWERHA